jgi:hypothetical protein
MCGYSPYIFRADRVLVMKIYGRGCWARCVNWRGRAVVIPRLYSPSNEIIPLHKGSQGLKFDTQESNCCALVYPADNIFPRASRKNALIGWFQSS